MKTIALTLINIFFNLLETSQGIRCYFCIGSYDSACGQSDEDVMAIMDCNDPEVVDIHISILIPRLESIHRNITLAQNSCNQFIFNSK